MILMLGLMATFATQGSPPPLTIDEAIRIAYKNSFAIKAAESAWQKTHQQINQAKGQEGPQVTISASDTAYEPGYPAFSDSGTPEYERTSKHADTTITLPVDISGNYKKGIGAAKAAEQGALDEVASAANDVRHNVRTAYYKVLAAEESLKVDQQALEDANRRYKDTQVQFEAGTAARVDVLRAQVQVSSASIDLRAAQNATDLAKQSFNQALGRAIETPVEVEPVTETVEVTQSDDALVNLAIEKRPDLLSLKENAKVLSLITKTDEAGLQPSLNFSAQFQRDFNPPPGLRVSQTIGVATLSWPVFDSGITRAKVKEGRQDEVQNQINIDQLSLGISLQVRTAVKNLQNAADRLKLAEEQVAVAEEAFRLSNVRHDAGEGILLEVIDAQTDLTQARVSEVSARYDYLSAYADLQQAIGVDQFQQASLPQTGTSR